MRITRLRLRDFRSYAAAELALGPGLNVVHGRNGAGKTNLLEGLYFGLTGRSCRTTNEREVVSFGMSAARVEVEVENADGLHELAVGFQPGEPKRLSADGMRVERMADVDDRPLVSVFLPDRLELVKGAPALRRAHLDKVVAPAWPARAATRRAYTQALAQRNALIARVRAGHNSRSALPAWDAEVARHGIALRDDRAAATDLVRERFTATAAELGLAGAATVAYRPRSSAASAEDFAEELAERTDSDLDRGFSGHGPHRDDLALKRDGRDLRSYGSQGEQRLALLALLLAERDALAEARGAVPLLLLDDVMSELDAERRGLLVDLIARAGQALVTTTDLAHVPGGDLADVARVAVADGTAREDQADPGARRDVARTPQPGDPRTCVGAL